MVIFYLPRSSGDWLGCIGQFSLGLGCSWPQMVAGARVFLKVSLFMCLVGETDCCPDLSRDHWSEFPQRPLHVAWASSQWNAWLGRTSVPRESEQNCFCFSNLASEVMWYHFHWTLFIRRSLSGQAHAREGELNPTSWWREYQRLCRHN